MTHAQFEQNIYTAMGRSEGRKYFKKGRDLQKKDLRDSPSLIEPRVVFSGYSGNQQALVI